MDGFREELPETLSERGWPSKNPPDFPHHPPRIPVLSQSFLREGWRKNINARHWGCCGYSIRVDGTIAFIFGDDKKDLGKYAWFRENSGSTTHAVGEKLPNGWGLYDMHGNVWEWCSDGSGSCRVGCGGNWFDVAEFCRSAYRPFDPDSRFSNYGFRLALSSPSVQSPEAEPGK